ncbi:hypothetical protein [Cellulosimicrobium sp. SH8]|uniref:hypothetical protein n=1 Tax=Cellulosimicrobium sp. SH8 TaxID=2952936 RepID=UPI0021F3BBFA|nr:hypothetical protein [Cellulosimicrobium sp. SH8]
MVRLLWVAGFLVGTTTHVLDLTAGGTGVYAGFPPAVRAFWVSLTLLDPLVVLLLVLRRRAAVPLGVAVMVADVAVNATVAARVGGLAPWGLVNQSLFCVLVLVTARVLWRADEPGARGQDRRAVGGPA